MSDELLQAVLDAPDDDAPRLAYADWCDQNGNPRGQFIRFQIEHAEETYLEWAALSQFADAWAEPIGPLVQRFEFRRGFVQNITVDAPIWLAKGEWMLQHAPIRYVDLRRITAADIAQIADSPTLLRITGLFLDHNHLDDADIIRLVASPNLKNLRWLGLTFNGIGEKGVEALAASTNLPSLERLSFDQNRVAFMPRTFTDWDGGIVSEEIPPLFYEMVRKYGPKKWLRSHFMSGEEWAARLKGSTTDSSDY